MKKILMKVSYPALKLNLKSRLIQNFAVLFMTVIAFQVSASAYSQQTKLDINLENATLEQVFNVIKEKTGYDFFYKTDQLPSGKRVTVNRTNVPIEDVLIMALQGTNLGFYVLDNDIVISSRGEKGSTASQQILTITGKVADTNGQPLPGVTVVLQGTTQGTITDVAGNYTLTNVQADAVLIFSFVGMRTTEISVSGRPVVNATLEEEAIGLEEVVAIGYGTSKVRDLTSSITTIGAEEITRTPSGQVMQGLQGKVAGLQIVSSGSPGDSPTIRVRGIGSYPVVKDKSKAPLEDKENEAPLYVVDGMFFDNIDFLNTADITSISVLKDASAAAIYGVRAANGVVLIETKSGKYNQKSEITYDGYYGIQIAQNVLEMANTEQFVTMVNESGVAADISNIQSAINRYGSDPGNSALPNVNTDWYKELLRTASIHNHSLNLSGGDEKASYAIGMNYFGQKGILDMKNEYERFNLRSKIDFKVASWITVGGNMIFSNATRFLEQEAAWNEAYFAVPVLPVYDETNTKAWPVKFASAQHIGYRSGQNPFTTMEYNQNRQKIRKLLANFYATIGFVPDKLSFKTSYNSALTSINQREAGLPYYISDGAQRNTSSLTKKTETYFNQIWDNVLTYTDKFDKHSIEAMAGTSYRDESYEMLTAKGEGMPIDDEQTWYIAQSTSIITDDVNDDGRREYGISYFGRVSYNFDNKYLLYGTMRADGSSKYQEKWGYFPTIGAGWVISEENFMNNSRAIDFLKLRGSWGKLGNDKIAASDGAATTSVITGAINDVLVSGTSFASTFSWLKWEVTEEWNVGITSKLLDNRLSADVDYFIRDTKNAAISISIPAVGGTIVRNVGIIRNSGFEVALNWNDKLNDNFGYSIGVNMSTLKNEVRDLYGQPYIDGGTAELRQRSIVGEPLLAFFGYERIGVYQNDAEIQADPVAVANGLVPGDFIYRDQDGSKTIDDDDRTVLGSYFPKFMYGVNLGITYKDFEFFANIFGQTGNKILNRKRGEIIWTSDQNMDADLAKNRWHGEGTSNKYPSSAGLRKGWNQKMSDYFVEDGSFFRIQNIQLAYNLNGKYLFGSKCPDTKITFTAERPLTVFKYNGFNPEVADGVDTQMYPIPAVYTVGLRIKL